MTIFHHAQVDAVNRWLVIALIFFIPISTTLTQVLMGLILLSWLFTGQLKEKIKLALAHPVARAVCVLFLIFLLGMTYTVAPWRDALSQLGKMSKVLYLVCLLPLFQDPRLRKWGIWAFIAAMTLTLILGFLKVYFNFNVLLPTRHGGASVFKNHIDTNLMMSLALFFTRHDLIQASRKTKAWGWILTACMTFYCLWMNDGRTGYIIFILLWTLFCLQRLSMKETIGNMSLLLIVISLMVISPSASQSKLQHRPQLQERLKHLPTEIALYHQGQESSIGQRLDYFFGSFTLIQYHPVLGWGTGSFKTAYEKESLNKFSQKATNPHNEYLNMFVQWGILGLAGFLMLLVTVFKMSFKLPPRERYLVQGLLAAMAVGCLANSLLMDVTSGYLFVTLTALCFSAYPIRQPISVSASARSPSVDSPEKPFALEGR